MTTRVMISEVLFGYFLFEEKVTTTNRGACTPVGAMNLIAHREVFNHLSTCKLA